MSTQERYQRAKELIAQNNLTQKEAAEKAGLRIWQFYHYHRKGLKPAISKRRHKRIEVTQIPVTDINSGKIVAFYGTARDIAETVSRLA